MTTMVELLEANAPAVGTAVEVRLPAWSRSFSGTVIAVDHKKRKALIGQWEDGSKPSLVSFDLISTSAPVKKMSEEEVVFRMNEKFETLRDLTYGVSLKQINGLMVFGSKGIGKTTSIVEVLDQHYAKTGGFSYKRFSGHMTPLQLFIALGEMKERGNICLFDDCDSVFQNPTALNVLKAATDTRVHRIVSWNSSYEGLPFKEYDFQGNIIIVTNSKVREGDPHFGAMLDRMHSLDFSLSAREKLLYIRHKAREYENAADMEEEQIQEVLSWMSEHLLTMGDRISLRTFGKLVDLYKMSPTTWKRNARFTVLEARK